MVASKDALPLRPPYLSPFNGEFDYSGITVAAGATEGKMDQSLGKGLLGSLRARVDQEIRELARDNATLRRARYPMPRRLLQTMIVDHSLGRFLLAYLAVLSAALICEWAGNRFVPELLPGYYGAAPRDFLKDVGSYLIAAQVGVLAIVAVAVAVVTLLSEPDGSSVNTDIRLYYFESYAKELTVSGVALLIVLTLQLFWPLQHVLHAAGFGGRDYAFKLALACLHAIWFSLNLLLFLQFITTTLIFVDPTRRERLREKYCANEVIPKDAKRRLLQALYSNAPSHIFDRESLKDGPAIWFGFNVGLGDNPAVEITTFFSRPSRLFDVRLGPLGWVLVRWRKRAKRLPPTNKRFGQRSSDGTLVILPNFDGTLEGSCDLVLRRGDAQLTRLEKWIIKRCFRFERVPLEETVMLTPDNFLEQLINKLVRQTEQTAATGFQAALKEAINYHRFILAAQNTKDVAGDAVNLAMIGGFFTRPDQDWVRQYRRAFFAAASKIGDDTFFIDRLSYLAASLIPDDALSFPQGVLQNLLSLGQHQVVAMEEWVTKRALIGSASDEVGASSSLAGSDMRAYENALIEFVGGWERLSQRLILSFENKGRRNANEDGHQWVAFTKGLPVFQTHLHIAAYFFACAVWNDDALGADRFRDLLLRWLNPFHDDLHDTYKYSNAVLLTPNLVHKDWLGVQAEVAPRLRFHQQSALPTEVSGIILQELHGDVVCVCGLVALHWYAMSQQPSKTAAYGAVLTLRQEKRKGDGSDLITQTSKTTFRLLFDFAIRYSLNPRFADTSYSATIDGLVQSLTNLATPRMVSGRVYGGFGIDGFETLRTVLLAALAANLPKANDDGVRVLIDNMKADPHFGDDAAVQTFIWTIRQMVDALERDQGGEVFKKAAAAFSEEELDMKDAVVRLREILANVVATFETLRNERLLSAPLDNDRMDAVRRRMSEGLLESEPKASCFQGVSIRPVDGGLIASDEIILSFIDKGSFVVPEMSGISFEELPRQLANLLRDNLAPLVWRDLYRRPKRVLSMDVNDGTKSFWRRVLEEAPTVGPEPIVLVPSRFGEEILEAALPTRHGVMTGFNVSFISDMPSGGGAGYVGTIDGVHVYDANFLQSDAILCSRLSLRAIKFGVVHGENDVADFAFIESDTPERSKIRVTFARDSDWTDDVFVEFQFICTDRAEQMTPTALQAPAAPSGVKNLVARLRDFAERMFMRRSVRST